MRSSIWIWSFIVTVMMQLMPAKQAVAADKKVDQGLSASAGIEHSKCIICGIDIDDGE